MVILALLGLIFMAAGAVVIVRVGALLSPSLRRELVGAAALALTGAALLGFAIGVLSAS